MEDVAPKWTLRTWIFGRFGTADEGYWEGQRGYHRTSPALLLHRVRHRLTGPQRGCSCSRCFHHPKRRIYGREQIQTNIALSELRQQLHSLRNDLRRIEYREKNQ